MNERRRILAERIGEDPRFLAEDLTDFARSEGLDALGLAARLGCTVEMLDRLRACYRPRSSQLQADLDAIAERFGVDRDVLAEIVRRVEVIRRMRRSPARDQGLLMAARDREKAEPEARPKGGSEP